MKFVLIILILFTNIEIYCQKITYNHGVNSKSSDYKQVMRLFESYLKSNPHNKRINRFWNSVEQRDHENFDFLESEFLPSLYSGFPAHVLSIKSNKSNYEIKVQFSYCKEDGTPYVLAIVNYYAKKENGSFKLYNALTINKKEWNCTTVGIIDFYYPNYHKFNIEKARKTNEFINKLCKDLIVKSIPFEYYVANDYDEIQKLKGIDYYMGMGGDTTPKGKAADDKIYCAGLGEYYLHEVFHVQIDKYYPNKHFWVSEGIATFLGGSRGETLKWHVKRTNDYLLKHPEVDLSNMLTLSNLDFKTAYHYVLGGIIAKKIYEKGGWKLIIAFMSSGKTDQEYYIAIEKYLGIKKEGLNLYLREQLNIESKKL